MLANNQAEFSGKQQKSHKLSWIVYLEESHQVSEEERMGQRKRKMSCDSCLLCISRNSEVMDLSMCHCPRPGKHQSFCKVPKSGKGKAPGGAGYRQSGQSCSPLEEGSISEGGFTLSKCLMKLLWRATCIYTDPQAQLDLWHCREVQ